MATSNKLMAILIVVILVAATLAGYFFYSQTRVATPTSSPAQGSSAAPTPTSTSTATPTATATPNPTSTPTLTPAPTSTSTPIPTAAPPPVGYNLNNLAISPSEPWPGTSITISAQVTNNQASDSATVSLEINNTAVSTQTVQTSSGTSTIVSFKTTEASTGTYRVQLETSTGSTVTGTFNIVPNGEHMLTVTASYPTIQFTLNGTDEYTPYSELVSVGDYTVSMPQTIGQYTFQYWQNGNTSSTITVDIEGPTQLKATYTGPNGGTSCPSLNVWNGNSYVYTSEISDGPGWLGFIDYYQTDGTIIFAYSNPWSYIKLDSSQMQPENGYFQMTITQNSDEIFYLDSVTLLAVDHPADVNVFSTRGTYLYDLSGQGTIYTVSKNPAPPVSAVNDGQNVLSQVSKLDGNYTVAQPNTWNTLDLNLGNLTGTKQINLVVNAIMGWPTDQAGGSWNTQYANQPGVTPSPPPYMEVKNAAGDWVKVPNDREFPIPPVNANTFVVNLTGLFPTDNYDLRICYYQDIRFDYIGVDTTIPQPISVQSISPSSATLYQEFSTNSTSTGDFTRYGDVTALLQNADNMYVIGRQGDSILLKFPVNNVPIPQGMVRDYFIVASCWFKGNVEQSYLPFTVDPLPFQDMTSYPYPQNESYPTNPPQLTYLKEYNTRILGISTDPTDCTSTTPLDTLSSSSGQTVEAPVQTAANSTLLAIGFAVVAVIVVLGISLLRIRSQCFK